MIVTEASKPEGGEREMLGFETLTWAPIDRRLIDVDLLDDDEAVWLDNYHAKVLNLIGPLVDPKTRGWLQDACAPLGSAAKPQEPEIIISPVQGTVVIRAAGAVIAESPRALSLTEGDYEPVFYLPRDDSGIEFMERSDKMTTCPWKGQAAHFTLVTKSGRIEDAAWSYEDPDPGVSQIAGHVAFYRDKVTIEVL